MFISQLHDKITNYDSHYFNKRSKCELCGKRLNCENCIYMRIYVNVVMLWAEVGLYPMRGRPAGWVMCGGEERAAGGGGEAVCGPAGWLSADSWRRSWWEWYLPGQGSVERALAHFRCSPSTLLPLEFCSSSSHSKLCVLEDASLPFSLHFHFLSSLTSFIWTNKKRKELFGFKMWITVWMRCSRMKKMG